MAGIESYYNPKKNKKQQIPVDATGAKDAREAPDADIDAYVKTQIDEIFGEGATKYSIQATGKHKPLTNGEGDTMWVVTSSVMHTSVYQITGGTPEEAHARVKDIEKRGEEEKYAMETNIDYLTKQIIGLPADEYITAVNTKPQGKKKLKVTDDEIEDITKGFNKLLKDIMDDE